VEDKVRKIMIREVINNFLLYIFLYNKKTNKMGNVSSRQPTNKLNLLVEETKDFSFNISSNISQQAEQMILTSQSQTVNINLESIQGCTIEIGQSANIMAKQTAVFKAVFTNPRELLKQLTSGPNSLLGQAMSSSSTVMQDFLNTAKKTLGANSNADLRSKMTTILKVNIDQNSIQKCSQNIFTNQEQRVNILGKMCKDSKIKISQTTIVDAAQDCMFEIAQNALMEDPAMRLAVREFNGDYNPALLNELDASAKLPDACFNAAKTVRVPLPCPPCDCDNKQGVVAKFASAAIPQDTNNNEEDKKDNNIIIVSYTLLMIAVIMLLIHVYKIYSQS